MFSKLKQLLVTIMAAAYVLLTSPLSTPALLIPSVGDRLLQSINQAGVSVRVNDKKACSKPVLGSYFPGRDLIVICQEDSTPGGREHKWSTGDLTVLMHESTHLLQDCLSGSMQDRRLATITHSEEELIEYSKDLSEDMLAWIIETYTAYGADDITLWLEIEAFSTQVSADIEDLAGAIDKACPYRTM